MRKPICPVCGKGVNTEHPENLQTISPLTFRRVWMHGFCFELAIEEAQETPAKDNNFKTRYDEWLYKY